MASLRITLRALSLLCLALTGSASPHRHRHRQASTNSTNTRSGCFTDGVNGQRTLSADSIGSSTMSVQECSTFCRRYKLFGLEYGRECWCGDTLGSQSTQVNDSQCSFPCAGNSAQNCGAGNRLDVYTNGAYTPRKPATIAGAPYLGCFVDNGSPHPLPSNIISTTDMTGAKCAQNCAGFRYFGTEYGQECYCGNTAPTSQVADSICSIPCYGNNNEYCGAGQRLTVYENIQDPPAVADFSYHGCHLDTDGDRALTGPTLYRSDLTLEMCASFCGQYGWFGVEYSTQCFCGTYLDSDADEKPESECNTPCSGDSRQLCGGSYRLNVYMNETRASTQVSDRASVGGFSYRSCWTDDGNLRTLTGDTYASDAMTVGGCAAFCADYGYFGVEYAKQCFCGNALANGSRQAPQTSCGNICAGNATEWCGAPNFLSLYEKA